MSHIWYSCICAWSKASNSTSSYFHQ